MHTSPTEITPNAKAFSLSRPRHTQRENLKSRALEAERMDFNRGVYSNKYGTAAV